MKGIIMKEYSHSKPLCFLTSTEITPTLIPRKCWFVEELYSSERQNSFLRIRLEPPIFGRYFYLDQELVDDIVIAPRYEGIDLFPQIKMPITVYVCYIANGKIRNTGQVSSKDLQVIFIGEIYKTLTDAEKAIQHEKIRI